MTEKTTPHRARRSLWGLMGGLLVVFVLGGCINENGEESEAYYQENAGLNSRHCKSFPDSEYLNEKWGAYRNDTQEGFDAVRVGVHRVGSLDDPGAPTTYLEWAAYPDDAQHSLMQDVLCHSIWRMHTYENLYENFTSTVATSDEIANKALESIQSEHLRQTGHSTADEGCCYIEFEGHLFGIGCNGIHIIHTDGTSSRSECTWRP